MTPRRRGTAERRLGAWHRRLGLAAALVLVLLVVSGLLLNHAPRLGLDRRYVEAAWLLDWYGVHAPAQARGVALGAHWVSELDGRVYFDDRELDSVRGRLHGAVVLADALAVAAADDLWLLTSGGEVVERLGRAHGVPEGLRALGLERDGRLVVQAARGVFVADRALSAWQRRASPPPAWAAPGTIPPALHAELVRRFRGRGLSVERLLADLHGGRLLGDLGVWLVDLTALACLGLALSGLWLGTRRR